MVSTSAVQANSAASREAAGWKPFRLQQQPFFEDKNRAFWILQSAGWAGYFFLRTLSGIANNFGLSLVIHITLLTATGYSITLLMAAVYRRLIKMRPLITWVSSIVLVLVASAAFSAIETWSHATFVRPGIRPEGLQFFGSIILTVTLLVAWSALYYSINYYLLLTRRARPSWRCFATSSTPTSCSTPSTRSRRSCC